MPIKALVLSSRPQLPRHHHHTTHPQPHPNKSHSTRPSRVPFLLGQRKYPPSALAGLLMKRSGGASPQSPEATTSTPLNEMLLTELYTLQKRVDEVENTIQATTPSPPKSKSSSASRGGNEMESRLRVAVGFTSPATPLMDSPGRKGKSKAVKRKKRRAKRSKVRVCGRSKATRANRSNIAVAFLIAHTVLTS